MIRISARSLALLACLAGCSGDERTLAPGLVLDLGFEGTCDPRSRADLVTQSPPSGISFGSGVEGDGARFDGSGAALKLRGIDALGIGNGMTLELFVRPVDWINPYGPGGGLESLVSHSSIFTVAIDPHAWVLQARLTTDASEESLRLRGGRIQPGAWHHIALVLDSASGKARLVLNGEIVDEVPARGTVPVRSDLDLVIGTWFEKNQAFCGELDSIRLWKRALSDSELRDRAALLKQPLGP